MSETVYVAFGDASTGPGGSIYGMVLIPESFIDDALSAVNQIKVKYGGTEASPIHCREMTSGHARAKSCWAHLQADDVFELFGAVLSTLEAYKPLFIAGLMPVDRYPTSFRLLGRNGHADLTHPIDDKWRELWVFKHTALMLRPVEHIPVAPPPKRAPTNLPKWRFSGEVIQPGYIVSAVYIDREITKVRWFSKQLQWGEIARDMTVKGLSDESHLPIQLAAHDNKHPLLDVADIFAWHMGTVIGGKERRLNSPLYEVQTVLVHSCKGEIILGGAEEIEAMQMAAQTAGS